MVGVTPIVESFPEVVYCCRLAGSASRTSLRGIPRGRFCLGATPDRAGLIRPEIAPSGLTPPGLVKLAPPQGGRWSIRAVLLAGDGAPVRLCAAVLADGSCTDGVPVRGISQSLFARRPLLELRGVWLVLVDAGTLFDPIRAA